MVKKDLRGVSNFEISKPAGFMKLATIDSVDPQLMIAYVKLRDPSIGSSEIVPAQLPISYLSSGGGFIGGLANPGTPVVVAQAEGSSNYFIVSFLARDPSAKNIIGASKIIIPPLEQNKITIQASINSAINLDKDGITIGEAKNSVVFDINRKVLLNTFDNSYSLTQASKNIDGTIKRDRNPKSKFSKSLRYSDVSYDDVLKPIGMDPIAVVRNSNAGSSIRNPARVEKHEVVYEYEQFANVQSNDIELKLYNTDNKSNLTSNTPIDIINRREGRADALSLSLVAPNYLMETIKGTVIDIFGNILDINRNIIPIGKDNLSINKIKSTIDKDTFNNVYEQIKRSERKSLAYHFEVNARKEVKGSSPPNVNDTDDYARLRSRFFVDIDKEGVFKLNVPASSETGNVPLLTRYENYSTVNPDETTKDPNALIFNEDYKDVLIESFINNQSISLFDDIGNNASPTDRILSTAQNPIHIKHGTAYHDISKTCISFQKGDGFYIPPEYVPTTNLGSGRVSPKDFIVSDKIIVAGANANAGGRSGQLNFDGSIEINIGANTVDRQSLWADLQGGAVINIGRDLRNVSLAAKLDGEVMMEIGGTTVPAEKNRFKGSPTGLIAGVFDIRVYNASGELTILRVDNEGLTITTPGRIVFSANQDMMFRTSGTMHLDAETMLIQSRKVLKNPDKGEI